MWFCRRCLYMAKHSLDEILAEYSRLDALCGVDSSSISVEISKRMVSHYGYCHFLRKGKKIVPTKICIADFILACGDEFWNVIRHEYTHALVTLRDGKSHGHDAVWKAACLETGCDPTRTSKDPEAHTKAVAQRRKLAKYKVCCNTCGRSWTYIKETKAVKAIKAGKTCTCLCGSKKLSLIDYTPKKGVQK